MSLMSLPPELLLHILGYVGPSYFHSDLSRLRVCKKWSVFASVTCFRDFHVNPGTLRRILSSPYKESILSLIKDSMEILDLEFKGFEDWESISSTQRYKRIGQISSTSMLDASYIVSVLDGAQGLAVRAAWTRQLNKDLLSLATIIKQSRKLSALRIRAISEVHPLLSLRRRNYLYPSTVLAFFSIRNITSLELDLCGTQLEAQESQGYSEGFHICKDIAALLTTLQCLRLRMRNICTAALKPLEHSTTLRLKEMIINLSLSDESPVTTSASHTTCCDSSTGGFLQLKADLEREAQCLVTHMAAPKMARILTHDLPSIQLQAFDVLTSRTFTLGKDAGWDDDGETVEDQASDEESEIYFSDFPTDSDT